MPSRVRILLRNGQEGAYAHTGNHALEALEALYVASAKRIVEDSILGATIQPGPLPPPHSSRVERVKWLWGHLPNEWRKYVSLTVTREPRHFNYSRSQANPRTYGWTPWIRKYRPKKTAKKSDWSPSSVVAALQTDSIFAEKKAPKATPPKPTQPPKEPKPFLRLGVWS